VELLAWYVYLILPIFQFCPHWPLQPKLYLPKLPNQHSPFRHVWLAFKSDHQAQAPIFEARYLKFGVNKLFLSLLAFKSSFHDQKLMEYWLFSSNCSCTIQPIPPSIMPRAVFLSMSPITHNSLMCSPGNVISNNICSTLLSYNALNWVLFLLSWYFNHIPQFLPHYHLSDFKTVSHLVSLSHKETFLRKDTQSSNQLAPTRWSPSLVTTLIRVSNYEGLACYQ